MSQGAALAEFDLKMRGPGDMYGTKQSGTRMLKVASFSDLTLLTEAKNAAVRVFNQLESYPQLQSALKTNSNAIISPD